MTAELETIAPHARWLTAVALVMGLWLAGLPVAYLLILLTVSVSHLAVPVLFLAWAAVSIALTLMTRRRAQRVEPSEEKGRSRAGFATLRQRAALLIDAVLLVGGPVGLLLVLVGGTGFSMSEGAETGLIVVVVGGFLLLAAAVPAAVLNALWTLDRRTAAHEAAVLRGVVPGSRRVVRFARTVAWITWILYSAMALLLLVAAVRGAF
jgi:membrane protein implicated in regulation of membrane protease activity